MKPIPFVSYVVHKERPDDLCVYFIPQVMGDHEFLGAALDECTVVVGHLIDLRQERDLADDDEGPLASVSGVTVGCLLSSAELLMCCALIDVRQVGAARLRHLWPAIACDLAKKRSEGQYLHGETLQ